MILVEVEIAGIRTELRCKNNNLQHLAGHEDDAGRQQSSQKFSRHQDFTADRREKIKMQALVENFATEQIHENSQASEKYREAQIEELEYAGEHLRGVGLG